MPLCSELENATYYFNNSFENINTSLKNCFSSIKSKDKYNLVCHILQDSNEVIFTITK